MATGKTALIRDEKKGEAEDKIRKARKSQHNYRPNSKNNKK